MFQNIFKLNICKDKTSLPGGLAVLFILAVSIYLAQGPAACQAPPSAQPSARMAFVKAGCWGCHPGGDNAVNGDKPLKGQAFLQKYASDQSLETAIRKGVPAKGMPAYGKAKISDGDMKLILGYIRSLTPSSK
jgi:mono/diheme cytochrome c family protein